MKDKMPRVQRVEGADHWFVGDRNFGSMGGNVIAKDGNKLLGRLAFQNYDQINPGSYDLKERLKDMDAMGVWAHICFQNGGVTQAGSLVALDDEPLAIAITQIYNDACADRMKASGGRVNCMATLPYWDRRLMVAELRRIIDMGVKGITLPDRPERLSEGYLGPDGKISPFWEEVFDICNSVGLPFNFHLNASLDAESAMWDNLGFDQRLPMSACCITSVARRQCPTSWFPAFSTSTLTSRSRSSRAVRAGFRSGLKPWSINLTNSARLRTGGSRPGPKNISRNISG
jgi:hypothetical protein